MFIFERFIWTETTTCKQAQAHSCGLNGYRMDVEGLSMNLQMFVYLVSMSNIPNGIQGAVDQLCSKLWSYFSLNYVK
jgi:hypothetical protein